MTGRKINDRGDEDYVTISTWIHHNRSTDTVTVWVTVNHNGEVEGELRHESRVAGQRRGLVLAAVLDGTNTLIREAWRRVVDSA